MCFYVVSVTQEYLVYITKTGLVGLSLNNNTIHDVLPISSKQNVLDVDFDTLNKTMYIVQSPEVGNVSQRQKMFNCTKSNLIFTYGQLGFIFKFIHDTNMTSIFQSSVKAISIETGKIKEMNPTLFSGSPRAIAVDWIARNLYWTDDESGTIEVMRMDGENHFRKVLLSNTGKNYDCARPVSLVLDPDHG